MPLLYTLRALLYHSILYRFPRYLHNYDVHWHTVCVYVCARFCFIHICEGVHLYTEILQLEHRNCVLSVWAQISRKNLHREKKNDIGVHPFDTIVCVFFVVLRCYPFRLTIWVNIFLMMVHNFQMQFVIIILITLIVVNVVVVANKLITFALILV